MGNILKKILGYFLLVVGIIVILRNIWDIRNWAEAFGYLCGVSVVTLLPAYFLLRPKRP